MKRSGVLVGILLVLGAYATTHVAYAGGKEHKGQKEHEEHHEKHHEKHHDHEEHEDRAEMQQGVQHPVTLSNLGNKPLKEIEIEFSGKNPRDFRQTNNCGEKLGGKASCTINVTFVPKTPGLKTAAMEIRTSGGSKIVYLSGTGT